jgi:hypothetical protein
MVVERRHVAEEAILRRYLRALKTLDGAPATP